MEQSAAPAVTVPRFRRLGAGFMRLDIRNAATMRVEDTALAGGYFVVFWLLDAVNLTAFGSFKVETLASAWPAIAVLGCAGVLFRRTAPTAMAWMCATAAAGLLLAGHAGAFILVFEFFFSLVLFGRPKTSLLASRTAWALTVLLVVGAYSASMDAGVAVAAGFLAFLTMLTPVEWAGNLRKANQLAQSESARADAVHEAAQQRILAERSAHDLALEHVRQHMTRELHDVISARLSAIALQSGAALHTTNDAGPETPGTAVLRQIRAESVAGLDELNTMIRLLHTGAQSEAPGRIADLQALVECYRTAGMDINFTHSVHDGAPCLPLPVQTAVYRVASEALANAARHSPGQPVRMVFGTVEPATPAGPSNTSRELLLTIDSGLPHCPTRPSAGTGTGLPSMHFRATHAGGTLAAGPDGRHWRVALKIPAGNQAAPAAAGTIPEGHRP